MAKRKNTISRYVYLMSVSLPWSDLRWVGIALSGDRLTKIGVAIDTKKREETVDKSHDAEVRLQDKYYCRSATRHESYLHRTFKEKAYPIIGMDGGTEVYRLSGKEIREAKRYLRKESSRYHNRYRLAATGVFTLIITGLLLVLKLLQ